MRKGPTIKRGNITTYGSNTRTTSIIMNVELLFKLRITTLVNGMLIAAAPSI